MPATSSSTCSGPRSAPSTTSRRSGRSSRPNAPTPTERLKITLLAVGKLGRSAEQALAAAYAERATGVGRALGLGPVELVEVEARKPGKAAEAEALSPHYAGAHLIVC